MRDFVRLRLRRQVVWLGLMWLLAAPLWAGQFTEGLLWEVSGEGMATSYLFGTIHSEDARVTRLPAPVEKAFEQAETVTLEVALTPEALMVLGSSVLLTDGTTLKELVGEKLFRRTARAIEPLGVPEPVLLMMKPWAAATTLLTPPGSTGMFLDRLLQARAEEKGKPVAGLESPQEQMAVFDSMSLDDQIALLRDTLDQLPELDAFFEELLDAYLDRDLARLLELNEQSLEDVDADVAETFNRRVILERNRLMADRMEPRFRKGSTFVAIGALHLPGQEGVLALLSQRGYRLRRLY